MGYRHDHDSLLDAAVEAALADGIGQLTFGRLAKRLGIADRTIVYYFPTKDQLIAEVLGAISLRLLTQLQAAFGEEPQPAEALLEASWPVVCSESAEPIFRVFLEASGHAVSGVEPYVTLIRDLVAAWHDWLVTLIATDGDDAADAAAALIAQIDGLMMLRLVAGPARADQAYEQFRRA